MPYRHLGEDAFDDEKYLKALNYFQKAYALGDRSGELLLDLALTYEALGNDEEALKAFHELLEVDPEECRAYYGIGSILDDRKDLKGALPYYEKAITLNPFYDRAYFFLASGYDELGETKKAIFYYEELLNLVPDDFWGLTNLGSIYENDGLYEEAYKLFYKAYEVEPQNATALFNMGVICGRLKRYEDAILYYKKALKKEPSPYTFLNLAVLYKDLGYLETGIHYLSEGIHHNPQSGFLYYNRACFWALVLNRELAQTSILNENHLNNALLDFKKSVSLNKDFLPYGEKDEDLKLILSHYYRS